MNMRLDQPGANQPATGIVGFAFGREAAADCDDLAAADTDIE